MKSDLLALAAIALWGLLAPLGVQLRHVPSFLRTGRGLLVYKGLFFIEECFDEQLAM